MYIESSGKNGIVIEVQMFAPISPTSILIFDLSFSPIMARGKVECFQHISLFQNHTLTQIVMQTVEIVTLSAKL